ncbi:signal peptidase I [Kineosporia sp. J2-2]|uniref:Signal peptidase I n=1 Tax=Kineosporia corallincola TaxID=2835133 RepID=A0ABS5T975_9ACTN|nr:signal peptidase I [Kineosporia corallincola]MBT0767616.1 signal peptidase I [Kineosporia corallincola]
MAVVTTAPNGDLPCATPQDVTFDEIVSGTGRAAEIGLGTAVAPSITLVPRRKLTAPRERTLIAQILYHLGNLVSTLAFALFLFLAVGPHLFPYQTMTMLTGSMAPTIEPGDVAVDSRVSVYDLRPGDIITYHIPVEDNRIVSHRIVSVTPEPDGSVTVQTKGDANPGNDPWVANFAGGTAWRVDTVIPKIGQGIRFLRQPGVAEVARFAAPALLVAITLPAIWRPTRRRRTDPDPHDVQYRNSPFAPGSRK